MPKHTENPSSVQVHHNVALECRVSELFRDFPPEEVLRAVISERMKTAPNLSSRALGINPRAVGISPRQIRAVISK